MVTPCRGKKPCPVTTTCGGVGAAVIVGPSGPDATDDCADPLSVTITLCHLIDARVRSGMSLSVSPGTGYRSCWPICWAAETTRAFRPGGRAGATTSAVTAAVH